jgi:hypothetical protein
MLRVVKEKWHRLLPYLFMLLAALSRWPGLFPPNFSVFYGLAFCAGAFFPKAIKWWLPLGTLAVTDILLDLHYGSFSRMQLVNYAAYAVVILLGSRFTRASAFVKLLSGGILGAVLFYLITNTAAWFFNPFQNPEYTKDLTGWLIALTKGTAGYPTTLEFFFNTLMSGGIFTGLFAGALKLAALAEPKEVEQRQEEPGKPPEAEEEPGAVPTNQESPG